MSNYNLQIPWSGKDSLNDNDPDKVVSGGDFNTEFLAVKTAVNSKADLAGSASQAFSATTANANINTTQVATTQYVTSAVTAGVAGITAAFINNLVYPVGSIYTNMVNANNPSHATLLGFGTWVAYATGRVLVGKASSGTFDTVNEDIGSETHALSIAELPAHAHKNGAPKDCAAQHPYGSASGNAVSVFCDTNGTTGTNALTESLGSGTAHTNLQPSVTVFMWKRTG